MRLQQKYGEGKSLVKVPARKEDSGLSPRGRATVSAWLSSAGWEELREQGQHRHPQTLLSFGFAQKPRGFRRKVPGT